MLKVPIKSAISGDNGQCWVIRPLNPGAIIVLYPLVTKAHQHQRSISRTNTGLAMGDDLPVGGQATFIEQRDDLIATFQNFHSVKILLQFRPIQMNSTRDMSAPVRSYLSANKFSGSAGIPDNSIGVINTGSDVVCFCPHIGITGELNHSVVYRLRLRTGE